MLAYPIEPVWGGTKGRNVGDSVKSSVWGLKQYSEPGGKTFLRNRDANAAVNLTMIYISLRDHGVVPYRFRKSVTLGDDYRPPSTEFKWKLGEPVTSWRKASEKYIVYTTQEKFKRLDHTKDGSKGD